MNAPHPRVLRLVFYLPHDHHELAAGVSRALDTYLHAVGAGPETLGTWCDTEGEGDWFPLNDSGWEIVRSWLRPGEPRFVEDWDAETFLHRNKKGFETLVSLAGATPSTQGYAFHYLARLPWRTPREAVSAVSVSLPTEFLERQGPDKVKALALELAAGLPFSSGHGGLAFHLPNRSRQVMRTLREDVFRYPGLDVPVQGITDTLGTRVEGVHWSLRRKSPSHQQGQRHSLHFTWPASSTVTVRRWRGRNRGPSQPSLRSPIQKAITSG